MFSFIFVQKAQKQFFFYLKNVSVNYGNIQSHTASETTRGKMNWTSFLSEAADGNKWIQMN